MIELVRMERADFDPAWTIEGGEVRLATYTERRYIPWRLKVTYPDLPVSRRSEELLPLILDLL